MQAKGHIEQTSGARGWDEEPPGSPEPCKDGEAGGHSVSPVPADCLAQIFKEEGFKEGTVEHTILEKQSWEN